MLSLVSKILASTVHELFSRILIYHVYVQIMYMHILLKKKKPMSWKDMGFFCAKTRRYQIDTDTRFHRPHSESLNYITCTNLSALHYQFFLRICIQYTKPCNIYVYRFLESISTCNPKHFVISKKIS